MSKWSNWSGRLSANPNDLRFARSIEDVQAIVRTAGADGRSIRTAGATHSHAPLVQHDDMILDVQGLSGVLDTNPDEQTAWIAAGTRIYALGAALNRAGLGLVNQGDIDQQAIAGATATGTHGTGIDLQNLSAAVRAWRLVLATGDHIEVSEESYPDLWQAGRLHLGAFGVVTALQLKLCDAYRLRETMFTSSLDDILRDFDDYSSKNRHCEFFWYPQQDVAHVKLINKTQDTPEYPLADEGARCAWSHEVLPNHRPHFHTEMEYSVPNAAGPDCMKAIRDVLKDKFPDVAWPVEYRTLARDDVWLSTAYQRDTVTISVHQDVRLDERNYYRACEEVFTAHEGRPHWGKIHNLDGPTLEQLHPRWHDWWQVRNTYDPDGVFLNEYLRSLAN